MTIKYNYIIYNYMDDNTYEIIDVIQEDNILDDFIITDNYIFNFNNNITTCLLFDTYKYVYKNFKSYDNSIKAVYKQFILDAPRSNIVIFNKLVKTEKDLNILHNHELKDILVLLCTQSSFALPCIFLNNLVKQVYLTDCDSVFVSGCTNNSSISNISISNINNSVEVQIYTTFLVRTDSIFIKNINVNLLITFTVDTFELLKNGVFTISYM